MLKRPPPSPWLSNMADEIVGRDWLRKRGTRSFHTRGGAVKAVYFFVFSFCDTDKFFMVVHKKSINISPGEGKKM